MPMKKIISSVCGVGLLAGCASERCATYTGLPPYYYRQPLTCGRTISEPREITRTEVAVARRHAAACRTHAAEIEEASFWGSSPAQPSGVGVSNFMPAPGPASPYGPAVGPASIPSVPPGPPLGLSPVAEKGGIPFATPVPGKPGFVVSPFSPNSGYVDVSGMTPGSEARDPYTGKVFRVP